MPFWSDRAYAQQCAKEEWASYTPTPIDLAQFAARWLPGLAKDGLLVGANWSAHLIGEEIEPLVLKERLDLKICSVDKKTFTRTQTQRERTARDRALSWSL
jgi:hypothetical protein